MIILQVGLSTVKHYNTTLWYFDIAIETDHL